MDLSERAQVQGTYRADRYFAGARFPVFCEESPVYISAF